MVVKLSVLSSPWTKVRAPDSDTRKRRDVRRSPRRSQAYSDSSLRCSGVADLLALRGALGRGAGRGAGAAGGAGLLLRGVGDGLRVAAGAVRRRRLPHIQERAPGRTEDQ